MRKNYQIFTEIISIKKNWPSQNIDFLNFKKVSLGQSLANLNSRRIYGILKLLLVILKSEVWKKKVCSFFYHINFRSDFEVLKSMSPCFYLNQRGNINEKQNGIAKGEIVHTGLKKWTFCFILCKIQKLLKPWWVRYQKRK